MTAHSEEHAAFPHTTRLHSRAMARQTITTCDFDHGNKPAEGRTVTFAVDRDRFSIDLCDQHQRALTAALTPFSTLARRGVRANGNGGRSAAVRRRPRAALRVADLSEAEKNFARRNGWGGKRLSNELIAKIQERRTKGA